MVPISVFSCLQRPAAAAAAAAAPAAAVRPTAAAAAAVAASYPGAAITAHRSLAAAVAFPQCRYTPTRACSSSSNGSSSSSSSSKVSPIDNVELLEDKVVYRGWRTVLRRSVRFPDGAVHAFDVTTAPPAILALPFCSKTKTVTLLREYCPGPHKGLFSVVAGLLEEKHQDVEECVRWETEEEAGIVGPHKRGGRLVCLMDNESGILPGAKYTSQPFLPFIVIDGNKVEEGRRAADADELMETHEVSVEAALDLVLKGQLTSTGSLMVLLAAEKLRRMKAI